MGWLKPKPQDDGQAAGFANNEQMGGYDDDNASIRPASFANRLFGAGAGIPGYFPSRATLFGPHFRIGYFAYNGIATNDRMQRAESDSVIGMPTILRPPIIPRRSVQPASVRNAITFVQSMPYETWAPIIPPLISRR